MASMREKGLLFVSFGTTHLEQLEQSLFGCTKEVEQLFSSYQMIHAFSSEVVRTTLWEQSGVSIPSVAEALEQLGSNGCKEVWVQPLHLLAGKEYEKVRQLVENNARSIRYHIGTPLLLEEDLERMTPHLLEESSAKRQTLTLWIGHGTTHKSQGIYSQLDALLRQQSAGQTRLLTLNELDRAIEITKDWSGPACDSILLRPLMLVAGRHVLRDIIGSEPDTWCSVLQKEGIRLEVVKRGIGQEPWFQKWMTQKVSRLLGSKS